MEKKMLAFMMLSLYVVSGEIDTEALRECGVISQPLSRLECYDREVREASVDGNATTLTTESAGGNWVVDIKKNPIDESTSVTAMLAGEPLSTEWGRKDPVLVLRCAKNTTDVFVAWPWYMGNSNQRGMIRFDKENPIKKSWTASSGGEALFYQNNPITFIKQMIPHKTIIISGKPYRKVSQYAIFHLDGINKVVDAIREACHWRQ